MPLPLELTTNTHNTGRNFYSVASKAAYYSTSGGGKECGPKGFYNSQYEESSGIDPTATTFTRERNNPVEANSSFQI